MTWLHVREFVIGEIPRRIQLPSVGAEVSSSLLNHLAVINSHFQIRTETEVRARVTELVIDTVQHGDGEISTEMLPTVSNNSAMTDYLVVSRKRRGKSFTYSLSFVEIKNPSINTDLRFESDAATQALREAHILLLECEGEKQLPFVSQTRLVNLWAGREVWP